MSGKTHPHIERPSEEQIAALLEQKDPELRQVYLAVHKLVLDVLPEIKYEIDCTDGVTGYGSRQYGYDGWGMAALAAFKKWISLTFMHGAELPDETGLLQGDKLMRHVRLQSYEQFEQCKDELRILIELAAALHDG